MRRHWLLTLGGLLAFGCAGNGLLAPLDGIGSDGALGRTIERDTTAPVQTDSLVQHLTRQGPQSYSVDIPFRFRNDTGKTISVVNCHGGLNMTLEKRIDGAWETFYQPELLMCLSPPIQIAPGQIYQDQFGIYGTVPGTNAWPQFASAELDGEYRLVWGNLVHDYDPNQSGFGSTVGPLRSNPFLLVAPE
jgi:hypothetical protein